MTLPKFVLGMVMVVAIVLLWSYLDAAAWGTILLRVLLCAVILQVGYFVVILAMVLRAGPKQAETEKGENAATEASRARPADDLTPKSSAH